MSPTERVIVSTGVLLPYPFTWGQEKIHFVEHCVVLRRVRKTTIRCLMPVCPSVFLYVCPFAWNSSAPTGEAFSLKLIFEYFSKICREIKASLKYDKNNGRFIYVY